MPRAIVSATVGKLDPPRVRDRRLLVRASLSIGKIFGWIVFKSLSLMLPPVCPLWFGAKSDTDSLYRCSFSVSSFFCLEPVIEAASVDAAPFDLDLEGSSSGE